MTRLADPLVYEKVAKTVEKTALCSAVKKEIQRAEKRAEKTELVMVVEMELQHTAVQLGLYLVVELVFEQVVGLDA